MKLMRGTWSSLPLSKANYEGVCSCLVKLIYWSLVFIAFIVIYEGFAVA